MSNGTNYWGSINLNAIKEAIEGGVSPFEGKKGKYLEVSVWVNEEPDQFGNSLSIQVYNKDTKQVTYLGNLKKSDFNGQKAGQQVTAEPTNEPDLPF